MSNKKLEVELYKNSLIERGIKPVKVAVIDKSIFVNDALSFDKFVGLNDFVYLTKEIKETTLRNNLGILNGGPTNLHYKAKRNILFNMLLNGDSNSFCLLLRKIQFKQYLAHFPNEVLSVLRTQNWFNHILTNLANKEDTIEKVMEAYYDNLFNLIPFIILYNKTPKELKEIFSNRHWKIISNNSVGKNRLLINRLSSFYSFDKGDLSSDLGSFNKYYDGLFNLPSTLLQPVYYSLSVDSLAVVNRHLKGSWSNYQKVRKLVELFKDTKLLVENLIEFDEKYVKTISQIENWSPRRLKEEHDKFSKELIKYKSNPQPYKWLNDFPVKYFSNEEYNATLLDSEYLIAEEGRLMGHCAAGYASLVRNKSYLIYSVCDKAGNRHSTIGFRLVSDITLVSGITYNEVLLIAMDQHYKKYNQPVTEEKAKELCVDLVNTLNKVYYLKQE